MTEQASPVPQTVGEPVPHRESITRLLADLRRIHTPEGIEVMERVEIGDTQQWISIRGLNRSNPVLLFIHGGPGSPMMPTSWAFQKPWEDFFTVVQWDQRGMGKNTRHTDPAIVASTLSDERVTCDAEEMVAYLRQRLDKEKILVLGFSWGTITGAQLAKRRPEWLHAYIGVGQAVHWYDDEDYLYRRLLDLAREAGNEAAVRELEALAPYPDPHNDVSKLGPTRIWARRFQGGWYGKDTFDLYFSLPNWAPEYEQADLDAIRSAGTWFADALSGVESAVDLPSLGCDFEVPIVILMGRYDLHTPYEAARRYFDRIEAPHKVFVTFERSSHFIMFEEPGRFLLTLVNEVLPLTREGASFEPLV